MNRIEQVRVYINITFLGIPSILLSPYTVTGLVIYRAPKFQLVPAIGTIHTVLSLIEIDLKLSVSSLL